MECELEVGVVGSKALRYSGLFPRKGSNAHSKAEVPVGRTSFLFAAISRDALVRRYEDCVLIRWSMSK